MARVDSADTTSGSSAGGFGHLPRAPGIRASESQGDYNAAALWPSGTSFLLVTSKVMTSSQEAPQEDAQIQVSIGPVAMSRLALLLFDTAWVKALAEDPGVSLSVVTDTGTISVDCLAEPLPEVRKRRRPRCSKCNRPKHNIRTCTYKRRRA